MSEQSETVRRRTSHVRHKRPLGTVLLRHYDFKRDGCPDTWGWVADVVNLGAGKPQEMMCPGSELVGSEKLNDLIGLTNTSNTDEGAGEPHKRWTLLDVDVGYGGHAGAHSGSRRAARRRLRHELRFELVSGEIWTEGQQLESDNRRPEGSRRLDGSAAPATARKQWTLVAGRPLDWLRGSRRHARGGARASVETGGPEFQEYADAGGRLAESFNDGPAYWDGDKLVLLPAELRWSGPEVRRSAQLARLFCRTRRDWYAWHGLGKRKPSTSCSLTAA